MRKGFRVQALGFSLIITFLLSTATCNLSPTIAAEATPSSNIKDKLEQLKQDIASKAAKIKQEISKELQNKAYTGNIQSISSVNLELLTKDGNKKITLNQDTAYENLNPRSKALNFGGLKKEATIAALGDIDDMGNLVAKKIVLLPINPTPSKTHLWGQVISVSSNSLIIAGKDNSNSTISIDTDTIIQKGNEEISTSSIKKEETAIIAAIPGKNGVTLATLIYLIPSSADPSPVPSPSPNPMKK